MMEFRQKSGDTTGSAYVTFKGTSYPYKNDFERKQNYGEAESGKIWVYDRGVENQFIGIKITNMLTGDAQQLETFIRNIARYRLNPFFFMEDNSKTEDKIAVRYWGDKFSRNMVNYNLFNVEFLLRVEV